MLNVSSSCLALIFAFSACSGVIFPPKSHISCAIAAIVSCTVIYQQARNQAISHALDGLLCTR
ncbi:hypothetical protein, partial [Streptococcus pyogenes]|uniref:hypothetical protein n=1 Tax=Streptococcus pyogenes TaxID=1314 RepID=UPI001B35422F